MHTIPKMLAVPFVGSIRPVRIFIRVVFPAPLCPNKHVIWSLYISKHKSEDKECQLYMFKMDFNHSISSLSWVRELL
jgi:hypothetical protein